MSPLSTAASIGVHSPLIRNGKRIGGVKSGANVLPAVKVYAPPIKSTKKLPQMKMDTKLSIHDPIEAIEARKVLEKKKEFFLDKLEEIWTKFGIPEIHK